MGKAKRARRPQGHPAKIESRRLQSAPIRAPRAADALTDEFVAWRQEESSKELTISFFEQLRANAELLGTNEVPVTHAMVNEHHHQRWRQDKGHHRKQQVQAEAQAQAGTTCDHDR
jgi:hypothetical protein